MRSAKLTNLLNILDDSIEGQRKVTISDILDALDRRGFGPLLVMPAMVTILPTGAIPGVPALCGSLIFLISTQIMFGRKHPWVPGSLGDVSISRKNLEHAIKKAKPVAEAIDEFAHPRYEALTKDLWLRVIAIICLLLAIVMMVIGFIPYVPAVLSLPVLLFAIGISVRDGLMTLSGFMFSIIVICTLPFLISFVR